MQWLWSFQDLMDSCTIKYPKWSRMKLTRRSSRYRTYLNRTESSWKNNKYRSNHYWWRTKRKIAPQETPAFQVAGRDHPISRVNQPIKPIQEWSSQTLGAQNSHLHLMIRDLRSQLVHMSIKMVQKPHMGNTLRWLKSLRLEMTKLQNFSDFWSKGIPQEV